MGPLPDMSGAFTALLIFAIVGLIALAGGGAWLLWWLLTHVTVGVAA